MNNNAEEIAIQQLQLIHDYNISLQDRTVYIHGHSEAAGAEEGEPGVEYLMATTFAKNMHYLDGLNNSPINIHMHSMGGEWNDGMAMYDVIKAVKSPVYITAHSWARSMTSIIFQAADKRIMMPHCDFMIHYGSMTYDGHCSAFLSSAEWTEKANKIMVGIYIDKCREGRFFKEQNYTDDQISKFLIRKMEKKSDWWINAKEAVHYGFADEVYGG